MRTMALMGAGAAMLLGAAQPAAAQFYRWRPYAYARPFYPYYAYPYPYFYRPPVVYAVPPPVYYPPPAYDLRPAYFPPPTASLRPPTVRTHRVARRRVEPAFTRPLAPAPAPAPEHDVYPPERSTN